MLSSSPSSSALASPTTPRPTNNRHKRKSSLCVSQPVNVPVPPSLIASPHLHAASSFCKVHAPAHIPSQRDEDWLGDTVPLSIVGTCDARGDLPKKGDSRALGTTAADKDRNGSSCSIACRAERSGWPCTPTRKISATSPPLVHWRSQHSPSRRQPEAH